VKDEKLPMATPQYVVQLAKVLAETFKKPLTNERIDEAMEHMRDTWQFDATTRRDAKLMLLVDQNPDVVLYENSRTKFIVAGDTTRWQNIKQMGKQTSLADFRNLITKLIAEYGSEAVFYIDSDHGDEYFILQIEK
jgi:hypothetical protein